MTAATHHVVRRVVGVVATRRTVALFALVGCETGRTTTQPAVNSLVVGKREIARKAHEA
jgi:hypothetical protein